MTRETARWGSTDGAGPALAWLAHPITLAALVALVVNDHLLKAAHPGVLTGKLSDVAGLVLAPPLLASLVLLAVRRLPARAVAAVSTAVIGAGFAWAKTTQAGAAAASAVWSVVAPGSVVLADRLYRPAGARCL